MEKSRPPIGENTESDDSGAERSFMSQFLDRLKNSGESDEEDDSAESGTDKKSKRWQKFFGKLFGGMVEKDHAKNTESTRQQDGESFLPIFSRLSPDAAPETRAEASSNEGPEHLPEVDDRIGQVAEADVVYADQSINSVVRRAGNNNAETFLPDSPDADLDDTNTPDNEPQVVFEAQKPHTDAYSNQSPDQVLYNTNTIETAGPSPVSTHEARIVSGADTRPNTLPARKGLAALTGLLGVEYFARRRADRKIRQEVKKVEKSAEAQREKLARQLDKTREKLKGAEPLARNIERPRLAPEEPRVLKTAEARQPDRMPDSETKPSHKVVDSKSQRLEMVPGPEKPKVIKPEALPRMETLDPVVRYERVEDQEKARQGAEERIILEKVADAAEHDVPIEKHYERRHEVKDASTKISSNAASVSSIISQIGGSQSPSAFSNALQPLAHKYTKPKSAADNTTQYTPIHNDDYKQAIKNGFWAAVFILIFILLIILIDN